MCWKCEHSKSHGKILYFALGVNYNTRCGPFSLLGVLFLVFVNPVRVQYTGAKWITYLVFTYGWNCV